jgi:2-polyprenyl-3-methyl-5-hydroxy-6-metoxy-1,4-benzoquinol methylase
VCEAVDFGAGDGIFARPMRDSGFNFFALIFTQRTIMQSGFELQEGATYEFFGSI